MNGCVRPPAPPATLALLEAARRGLTEATGTRAPGDRYVLAHLAALRAAAAVLSARARPATPGASRRPASVWVLLPAVAPELAEWAAFFAAGAAKRAAAEAGLPGAVRTREADDMVREGEAFLELVTTALGLDHQPMLPAAAPAAATPATPAAATPTAARTAG